VNLKHLIPTKLESSCLSLVKKSQPIFLGNYHNQKYY